MGMASESSISVEQDFNLQKRLLADNKKRPFLNLLAPLAK